MIIIIFLFRQGRIFGIEINFIKTADFFCNHSQDCRRFERILSMSQEKGLLRFFGQMDIFSFIHMSITEGLSQIVADGIDNAQLPPETILHLPADFPLLFSLQYKNHHNLLFIILFGRAQRLGIGKINLLYFPDLSGKR